MTVRSPHRRGMAFPCEEKSPAGRRMESSAEIRAPSPAHRERGAAEVVMGARKSHTTTGSRGSRPPVGRLRGHPRLPARPLAHLVGDFEHKLKRVFARAQRFRLEIIFHLRITRDGSTQWRGGGGGEGKSMRQSCTLPTPAEGAVRGSADIRPFGRKDRIAPRGSQRVRSGLSQLTSLSLVAQILSPSRQQSTTMLGTSVPSGSRPVSEEQFSPSPAAPRSPCR